MDLRSHDYSGDEAKQDIRLKTLGAVRTSPFLWNVQGNRGGGCLNCSWMEIDGLHSPAARILLDQGILPEPFRFCSINGPKPDMKDQEEARRISRAVCDSNLEEFREWADRGQYVVINRLLEDVLAQPEDFRDVGVLVADGHYATGAHDIIEKHIDHFRFAQNQADRLHHFLLVINLVQRGTHGIPQDESLEHWRRGVSAALGYNFPAEALHVYKSDGRRFPMVTCRIGFEGR